MSTALRTGASGFRPYDSAMVSTLSDSATSTPTRGADDEVSRLRIPPHSVDAEQSVLGGLLLDNSAWDRAGDLLTDSDFYRYEHRFIFAAIGTLINATKPADVITVFEQLQSLGKGAECGGLAYLNSLAQSVISAANIRRYAEIVRERAVLRKLVAVSDEIATTAFNPQGQQVSQILDEAEAKIFRIGEEGSRSRQGFQNMDSLVVQLIDRVNELHENGAEEVTGVRTGFFDLDRMTAGLQPGDLIVLAARQDGADAEHRRTRGGVGRFAGGGVLDGNERVAACVAHGRLARAHRPEQPAHRQAARRRMGALVRGGRAPGQGQHVHR
jgi:replicative DNA helicase